MTALKQKYIVSKHLEDGIYVVMDVFALVVNGINENIIKHLQKMQRI